MRREPVLVAAEIAAFLLALVMIARFGPYTEATGFFTPDQPHAHGHGDLVIRVADQQSMVVTPPVLVVAGDGTAYTVGRGQHTGLVWPVATFHLGEGEIQGLLKRASHDGLLAEHPTYSVPDVLDGGEATVEVATSRGRWTHTAYALEPGWGLSARGRLAAFVDEATGVAASATTTPYRPSALVVTAQDTSRPTPRSGVSTALWPASSGLRLADADPCAIVRDPATVRMLTTAAPALYRDHGATYSLTASVLLPGDSCSG